MVICVGCNPFSGCIKLYNYDKKSFKIFDVDKFETNPEDTNLRKFFEKINGKIKQPIDHFCIYFKSYCNSKFRNNFLEVSKNYNIKNVKIISIDQLRLSGAITSLLILPKQGDILWIFDLQEFAIQCIIWEYNVKNRWESVAIYSHETTKFGTVSTPAIEDLQILISKIENKECSPFVMIYHVETKIDKKSFKTAFKNYRDIKFTKFWDCSTWGLYFARYFQEKQKFARLHCVPILDRKIEVKINEKLLINAKYGSSLPIEEYEIIYPTESHSLKVYENNSFIQELQLEQEKVQEVILKVDNNGIHQLILKGYQNESDVIDISISGVLNGQLQDITRNNPGMNNILTKYVIQAKTLEYDSRFKAIGIDFGNTECVTAVMRRGGPDCIVVDRITTLRTMPSYIAFDEKIPKCGQIVIDRMKHKAEYSVFDMKRIIGKRFETIVIDPMWPFKVFDTEIGVMIEVETYHGRETKTPAQITSTLFANIKLSAEAYQNKKLTDAVLTIPLEFSSSQKHAIRIASKYAGWKNIYFLTEPLAAAFAYLIQRKIPNYSKILLFDFGGGSTKVCITQIKNYQLSIVSHNEDSYMGGRDFDNLLFNYFNGILKHKYNIDILQNNKRYLLMQKCQAIKCTLSVQDYFWLDTNDFHPDKESIIPISRHDFEEMAHPYKLRMTNLILKTLENANLQSEKIDYVFQVGGGCRMPMIKIMLSNLFPDACHQCSVNPDWVVAEGAAIYAYYLNRWKTN